MDDVIGAVALALVWLACCLLGDGWSWKKKGLTPPDEHG